MLAPQLAVVDFVAMSVSKWWARRRVKSLQEKLHSGNFADETREHQASKTTFSYTEFTPQSPGQVVPDKDRIHSFVSKNFKLFWISFVVLVVILTGVLFLIFDISSAIGISVFVWAVITGATILVFLPGKLIATGFGSLLGIGGSELSTGAGLISRTNESITEIAKEAGMVAQSLGVEPNLFFKQMVWMYIVIVMLICVGAFFEKRREPDVQ